jgi:hypothetical protein
MTNLYALDLAIKGLEAHPELHFQEEWLVLTHCGTGGCLAGMIALQAGWTPTDWSQVGLEPTVLAATAQVQKGDLIRGVEEVAREVLDHPDGVYTGLFSGGNTLADIKRIRDRLAYVDGLMG